MFSVPDLCAQDSTSLDAQTWIDFRAFYNKSEKLVYDGEVGLRGFLSQEDWRRAYINPAIQYELNLDLNLRGGIRFIYTRERNLSNTFEIRPWQGLRILWPRPGYMIISHYFRLEERFTWYTESKDFDFLFRFRYRFMVKTPNLRIDAIDQTFYLYSSLELFSNAGPAIEETFVDRNRFKVGLGWLISPLWRTELIYMRQNTRQGVEEQFIANVHVFRLRVRYYINPAF